MNRRRILWVAVAGLVLLVGGLALTVALIPEERVADAVARRAEGVLGEPVAIERVGLSILPLPGVRLTNVSVGDADSTALASVDRAELRVRILPLFRGRVVVRSLELERPRIAVEIDSQGVANFPVVQSDTSAGSSTTSITFAVDRIRITDGAIAYTNHQDGTRVHLDGWNQELSVEGAVREGALATLTLRGWMAFDDIAADFPGAVLPARDLALRVEHDAALDLDADRLDLQRLLVDFDGVEVGGSGRILGVNSGRPEVHVDLAGAGLDAGRLMAWVPDSLRARLALPDGRPVNLRGTAAFNTSVNGTVAPDTLPNVEGRLLLRDVAVRIGDAAVVEELGGEAAFSLDSVVARFDGRLLGERMNAGVAFRNPAAPVGVVALSGRADLGRLVELGLVPDTLGLSGGIRVDVRGLVPLDDPTTAAATGTLEATNVVMAAVDPAIRVPTATARFDGGTVHIAPFRVEVGPDRSGIELDITADGWILAAVDSNAPLPRLAVALQAEPLDLDALMGEPDQDTGYAPLLFARLRDRPIDGRTAAEIAQALGFAMPALPPVDARVDARFRRLVKNGLTYENLSALARVTPDAVTLEQVRFGLMGGVVDASGEIRPIQLDSIGAPTRTQVQGRYTVTDVGSELFFNTLTPFRDHLAGRLDMSGTVGMVLDRVALPERPSLQADGALTISEGRLANWAVLSSIIQRLGASKLDTLRFQDWAGYFHIDGTRVTLDEVALDGSALSARAGGWLDLGGQIDVSATVALESDLARSAGAIGQELLAASPEGRIPVGLRIHGDVESPDVALDLTPARDLVAGRASQAVQELRTEAQARASDAARQAEERARSAAEDVAEQAQSQAEEGVQDLTRQATETVAERVQLPDSLRNLPADSLRRILGDSAYALLPDSVKLRADSLQQAIRNALRERLRRLLPGGGGGG